MLNRLFIKDKEKRKKIAHFGAGIAILVHAYENYDVGHHTYPFFAVAGLVILLMAFFHAKLETRFPWIDGAFFYCGSTTVFNSCN